MDLYDFPMTYRGLTLNGHRNTDGTLNQSYENDTIRVDRFDFSRLQQRDQREAYQLITGGDLGDSTLAFRYLALSGVIKAPSGDALSDKIAALLQAFHVEESQIDFGSTEGASPFTFYDTTAVVGYTPYQKERFLCRPAAYPIITGRRSGGDAVGFALELVCADPRRYRDTARQITLNSGNSFSASCPNWNSTIGVSVHPVITFTMSGAGHDHATITLNSKALQLDLTGMVNNDVVVVDTYLSTIKKNGAWAAQIRQSAVDTFPTVPRGGATATGSNTNGISSIVLDYREARA